jgi:WD40 repeat protein
MPGELAVVTRKRSRPEKSIACDELKEHEVHVHKCGFVEWTVHGVTALASAPSGKVFAVARSGGRLELRVDELSWECSSLIGNGSEGEVSSLAFCLDSYLWVGRMNGLLQLYQVCQNGLRIACTIHIGGGAVWGLCVSPEDSDSLAVACDDGFVRIVQVDRERYGHDEAMPRDELAYIVRSCEKTAKRILCLDWCGDVVVCGDAGGGLRWLNATTGRVVGRGVLRKAKIWCASFAKNGREVVCGDSRGRVSVWDCTTFTISEEMRIEGMDGDIWSVAGEKNIVDNRSEVVLLGSASGAIGGLMAAPGARPGDPWAPLRGRKMHTHDIRALVRHNAPRCDSPSELVRTQRFIAGSLDATISEFGLGALLKDARIKRMRPFAGPGVQPAVQFDGRTGSVLARHQNRVDLWSISAERPPLLTIRLGLPSLAGEIRSCTASSNQRVIAVASADVARIFLLDRAHQDSHQVVSGHSEHPLTPTQGNSGFEARIGKVRPLGTKFAKLLSGISGSPDMAILGRRRSLCLVAITADARSLFVGFGLPFNVESMDLLPVAVKTLRWRIVEDLGCDSQTDRLIRIVISTGRRRLFAVSDSSGLVTVIDLDGPGCKAEDSVSSLPHIVARFKTGGLITAMAFADDNSRLAIAWSTNNAVFLDLSNSNITKLHIPEWVKQPTTCISISADVKSVVFSGGHHCVISSAETVEQEAQVSDNEPGESREVCHDLGWQDSLLGTCILGRQRIVLMHRPWSLVASTLPDTVPRKVYGT